MPEGRYVSGLTGRSGSLRTVARATGLHMTIWEPMYMGEMGKEAGKQAEEMPFAKPLTKPYRPNMAPASQAP